MPVDRYQNSTNYEHPEESNLLNVHKAMDYDPYGQPVVRISQTRTSYTSKNRQRVSEFSTWFFSTTQFDLGLDVWDQTVANGATIIHDPLKSAVIMSVSDTVGSKAVRQTRQVMPYIPGRPAEFSMAHRWEMPAPGIRKRIGVFDELNGIYFEDGGDQNYYCVIRSNSSGVVVEHRTGRQDWNGDRFDGQGPSQIVADPTAIQLLVIEYEWYGVGAVHFSFIMNGTKHRIHSFYHANNISDVYMSTPFLPIRVELENVSAVVSGSIMIASSSFGLEGTSSRIGVPVVQQIPLPGTQLTTANSFYPAISIRLKPNALSGVAILEKLQFYTVDNTTLAYRIYLNATVDGTWANHELPNSLVQVNTNATSLSGGTIIYRGLVPVTGQEIVLDTGGTFQLARHNMGTTSDTITIALSAFNSNKRAVGVIDWKEIR